MEWKVDWVEVKILLGKAALGGLYAAAAELAVTKSADMDTLLFALGVAGIRGLVVFLQAIKEAMKEKTVEAKVQSVSRLDWLKECL